MAVWFVDAPANVYDALDSAHELHVHGENAAIQHWWVGRAPPPPRHLMHIGLT